MLDRYRAAIRLSRAVLVVCLLLQAQPVAGQPALVQSAGGNDHYNTAAASASLPGNVSVNDAIAVFCVWGSVSQTLTGVTDSQANSYTLVDNPTNGAYGRAAMAYAIARTSGPNTVSCNFSTPAMGKSVIVHEVRGVNTTTPLDGHRMSVRMSPGSSANAITSGSITTTVSGEYILGFTFNDSGNQADWNAGSGYTKRQDLQIAGYTAASEDRIQPSAGAVAATFTATAASFGEFITGILAFRPGQVVTPTLVSVAVTPANFSIPNGTTQPFTATGTYSDSSTRNLTGTAIWTSSDPLVATIASTGVGSAVGTGTTTIQATSGGISGSTALSVTAAMPISVMVSPTTSNVLVPSGTQQVTATVINDADSRGVTWTLSGAGCSGAACGALSAASSASGAAITYSAPAGLPTPATVTLTAMSVSDSARADSAGISLSSSTTPAGSTFTESFGDSSSLCWSGGPPSCDQLWVVARGSGQSIVPTPGAPPPNTADAQSLRMVQTVGTGSYIYTTGTFPRIPSGTAFDLSFSLNVTSHAMKALDLTRLLTTADSNNGSGYPAQISFRFDGTNLQLQAQGSSTASNVSIALNAWHTVRLHVASGANASYLAVDGGAQNAFTSNARDFLYVVLGSAAGSLDAMTYYIGNISVDSALGGGLSASMYIDFETATEGTTITGAVMAASTHCGNGTWWFDHNPMTGMTISTTAQKQLVVPVTACGTRYTGAAGSRGLRYDMSQTDRYAAYNWTTTSSSASVGFFYKIGVVDSNWYSVFAITAQGGDFVMLHMHGGDMYLETWAGITNPIPISPNTWYWVTMQYNAGGTHYMQVYETNGWTLLGSASNVSTGNYKPDGIEIGRTGNEPGYPASYWYYDQIVVDYATGAFPILQGTAATLTSIAVTPSNPSIAKGTSQPFTATGTYSDGSTRNLIGTVSWGSSNLSVASINSAGVASAAGTGTATIQAVSGSVAGSTTLTVTPPMLASISVTPAGPSIATGATQPFIATGTYSDGSTQNVTSLVTWTSSNTSVATIESNGVANGLAKGNSTIQAASGSIVGSTGLTVTAVLSSITVAPVNPSIAKGTTQSFTATGTYTDGSTQNLTSTVSWTSSNASVAGISSAGLASGVGVGTSAIQATSGSISGSTTMTVTPAVLSSIAVAPVNPSIVSGTTRLFTATGTYSDGSTQNLTSTATWSSSNVAVATISSTGLASGVGAGTTTIRAASGAISGSSTLTVTSTAPAVVAYVQSASGNDHYNSASASARFAANVTASNAIAVFCVWGSLSQSLTSVTDTQGNTYTVVDNPTSGSYGRAAMAYAVARTSGVDTVSCNFSTGSMGKSVLVHEISGVNTSSPLDGHRMTVRNNPGGGANAVTSGSVTTTTNGDYIVGFTFNDSGNLADWTAGTGYTRRQDLRIASYTAASEDRIQSSAGAVAATFTVTAANFGNFITGILAFRPQ